MIPDRQFLKGVLLSIAPVKQHWLYRWCKRYVDFYNGDNNPDISTSGELRFMQHILPWCNTVFDVGAHVGHGTALAPRINPKLNVHCFEPSHITYQRLLSNRFPPNVVCNNLAMSSAPGEARLFVFEEGSGLNSLYRREGLEGFGLSTQRREETVRLDTVDHYCQERGIETIDYAKVDVAGHELEVFKGASRMLEQGRAKLIQFEYGGCNIDAGVLLKDIFRFFSDFDYTFYKIYPKELRLIARYNQRFENFQYQNWVIAQNGYSLLT